MRKLLVGIIMILVLCSVTRTCREGPPQRVAGPASLPTIPPVITRVPTRTPTPLIVPSPTPRRALADISPAAMADAADSTTARWEAYQREALGKYVRWQGEIMDVATDGETYVLMDTGRVTYQVIARLWIPRQDAPRYEKDQPITFEGEIEYIEQRRMFVVVEAIAVSFSDSVILELATVHFQ